MEVNYFPKGIATRIVVGIVIAPRDHETTVACCPLNQEISQLFRASLSHTKTENPENLCPWVVAFSVALTNPTFSENTFGRSEKCSQYFKSKSV